MSSQSVFSRNLPVVKQSLIAVIGNTGLFLKFVCILVIIGHALSYSDSAIDALSVTPGYLLPPTFWLWTAFTHCFLEVRLWQVCVDLITLGLCGKLIEPLWGSYEMILFLLLVNISVAFISTLFYLILYICTSDPVVLFEVHIHGMAGYIAGLSVAVKQIMPDHVLFHTRTPLGKVTNRHVPLLLFITSIVLYISGLLEGLYATMIGCGIAVSWTYLRFYQVHSNGTRGDLAESFTFASFFPTVAQPAVSVLSNGFFRFLVKLRLCRKAVRRYDVGAPSAIAISLPGMTSSDADRRRQKALRLLSERLNQQQAPKITGEEAWPLLDEASGGGDSSIPTSMSLPPTHTTGINKSVNITIPTQAPVTLATSQPQDKVVNIDV
ncbi:hypothetical protein HAZT_HAZT005798 [Hyalella azteca]|uniref:Transmembrane protein 115 n=1 Tax=Hyalella azteca TaxID=294128 RepID=A0A6A0H920_HYAAZ|nr:transmembrane protein 115 [Hyalella azteca]KAA0201764.1 hypothetical protein HAZT_HAZT005798 [Hyalella azteca]